jgi:hypothetical protein
VDCLGKTTSAFIEFESENLKEKDHFGDIVVDGRIILRRALKKQCGRVLLRMACSG